MDENTMTENTIAPADLVTADTPIALPFDVEPDSERYWTARIDNRRLIFRRGLLFTTDSSFAALASKLGPAFTINDRTIVCADYHGAHLTIVQVHAENKTRWQFTSVTAGDPV